MAEQKSSSVLTAPVHGAASVLRKVPGAGMVGRAAEQTLDKVGAVSPRGRRMAVYAGAGLLGAVGVVEWPVALTGAAVAWLTQPRPTHLAEDAPTHRPEPAHDLGTAALQSGLAEQAPGAPEAVETGGTKAHGGAKPHQHTGAHHPGDPAGTAGSEPKPSPGPLGPTARPDRTTL